MIFRRLRSSLPLAALACLAGPVSAAEYASVIWRDEFNQADNSAPNSANWVYERGATGWGNEELENYTDARENSYIASDAAATDGKVLIIKALEPSAGGYTSARLKTQGKFSAKYGRIEARLKTPSGKGLWPAFWMLGNTIATLDWPACGEIDIMEMAGAKPATNYGTAHGPGYSGSGGIGKTYPLPGGATYDAAYHVFAVDWSPDKLVWSVDGVVYHTVTPASLPAGARWVFDDSPFFILLDVAVGGLFSGNPDATTVFPQMLAVDYVRVYSQPPAPPAVAGAFATGATQVMLSWQPAVNPDHAVTSSYRVERATDAAFTKNLAAFSAGAATSYTDTTAAANTTYYYRILTLASSGTSDPTTTLTVKTAASNATGDPFLVNLSARAYCGTGNAVTIGGFVVGGVAAKKILVRAIGPTLTKLGLGAGEILRDPVLELHHGSAIIATNDNWETNANLSDLLAATSRTGATALDASDHASAALYLTLPPGVYSFVVAGKGDTSGIVLLETYDAD